MDDISKKNTLFFDNEPDLELLGSWLGSYIKRELETVSNRPIRKKEKNDIPNNK